MIETTDGFIKELTFETAEDLLANLSPWSGSIDLDHYIFRGHSHDEEYQLIPSSIRPHNRKALWSLAYLKEPEHHTAELEHFQASAEYQVLRNFYRLADSRGLYVPHADRVRNSLALRVDFQAGFVRAEPEEWIPDELLETAALAQHYGLPTRLLDWTYDPFTAAFFAATTDFIPDTHISIWCLNKEHLAHVNYSRSVCPLKFVTPAYSGNANLAAQSGLFTHWPIELGRTVDMLKGGPGNLPLIDRTPLDILLRNSLSETTKNPDTNVMMKFKLRAEMAPRLIELLDKAGYGPAKLFPGYSGVVREIQTRARSRS